MYRPKIIKCRLKTDGKSIAELKQLHKGQSLTYRDFENIQRANKEFDGLIVFLSLWDYDKYESYHLHGWDDEVDEKMMMGIYYAEQTHPLQRYKNNLEQFVADWETGNYDPGCSFCFSPNDVEEIDVISEEVKEVKQAHEKEQEKIKTRSGKKKRRKH